MVWTAKNGDRCATPPEQVVQSEYMRFGYDMSILSTRQQNQPRKNSVREKRERRKRRVSFAEAIGAAS